MPNTTSESQLEKVQAVLRTKDTADPLEKAAAALESQVQELKAERKIERFVWSLGVIGLVNIIFSEHLPLPAAMLSITFSLLITILLAKWLEVPFILPHLERWYNRLSVSKPDAE